MDQNGPIVNRVAQSGLITLNLEEFLPAADSLVAFDLKPLLFRELLLKEKDFREALKATDWAAYQDKHVAVHCSSDAIIPEWAYMLVTSYLEPVAASVVFGNKDTLATVIIRDNLSRLDTQAFQDKRLVIKGCGDVNIPSAAYVEITRLLRPLAKSIMYGEPCSTVPVYKQPKSNA